MNYRHSETSTLLLSLPLLTSLVLLATGCGEDAQPPVVQSGCQSADDCPTGFTCDTGVCVVDACVGDDCPCTRDGDCPAGQRCDVDSGECLQPECLRDSDCSLGQLCVDGSCETDVAADRDRDGVPDAEDSCPELANADQGDNDGDGQGDACDLDDDNDAIPDTLDNCPLARNPIQGDADADGLGNACDEDAGGIDVRGVLDFSAVPGADIGAAQVFITGRDEAVGITDVGAFVFDEGLSEPGRFLVRVQWPGFIPVVREVTAPDGVSSMEVPTIVMEPAVQGDEAVEVRATALLDGAEDHRDIVVRARVGGSLVDTTLTDTNGSFALRLSPVDHALTFSRDGFIEATFTAVFNTQGEFEGRFTIDRVPVEEASIVLSAVPTAVVRGKLTSGLNPRDWPNRAFVNLISADESVRRLATVSNVTEGGINKGLFEISGLPVKDYMLVITAQGHLIERLEIGSAALEDLEEDLGDIELLRDQAAALLRGHVRLADQGPDGDHSGVIVRATIGGAPVATSVSDRTGSFVFQASQEDHTLSFSRQGYQDEVREVTWDAQQERFELGGEPLDDPASAITLTPIETFELRGRLDSPLQIDDWANRAFVTLTSADQSVRRIEPVLRDGSFLFVGLRPGDFDLSISARGHLPVTLSVSIEDADRDEGVINLTPEALDDETAVLMRGVVRLGDVDEDGDHSDITVRGRVGGNLVFTTPTDDTGTFVFPVSREEHVLTFSKTGYTPSPEFTISFIEDSDPDDEVDDSHFAFNGQLLSAHVFTLEPRQTSTVSGLLTSPIEVTDWPSRSLVSLNGQGLQRIATVSNNGPDGRFEVAGLRPGSYTLSAQVLGHLPVVQTIEVPAQNLTLDPIALTPTEVSFAASVTDGDAPLEGVVVRARRGQVLADTTLSNEDGNFSLRLTPERHTLTLTRQGFQTHPEVTLDWDGRQFIVDSPIPGEPPFVLEANPVATVRGEVVSSQGGRNDWPNIAFVTLTRGQERRIVGVDNADGGRGQFQFVALTPGDYELTLNAQGHLSQTLPVTLDEGDNTLDLITLEAEANEEQGIILQGLVRLQGEEEDGDHGGALVRASVAGNLVATSQTANDGAFAFLTSRQDHTLEFTADNYLPRTIEVTFDEVDNRFEIAGVALATTPIALNLAAQADRDADGVIDELDNCPTDFNATQLDIDGDGAGDDCDGDADGDGLVNGLDNCPFSPNPMQEDNDGLGRGTACTIATLARPLRTGCGVARQSVDTRERPHQLQGSCGGFQAPEVVYQVSLQENHGLKVEAETRHAVVIYLLDENGDELDCVVGSRGEWSPGDLPPGNHLLVIDGLSGPESAGPMSVSVLLPQSCSFNYTDALATFAIEADPTTLETGDIDGDGHLDLVIGHHQGQVITVHYGDGDGAFDREVTRIPVEGLKVNDLELLDMDDDGRLDIGVVGQKISNDFQAIRILFNNGGDFTEVLLPGLNDPMTRLRLVDVNQDRRPDVVATATRDDSSGQTGIIVNQGNRAFIRRGIRQESRLLALSIADYNEDGLMDVARTQANTIQILTGQGDDNIGANPNLIFTGLEPNDLATADFDLDGHLDLVVTHGADDTLGLLRGRGDGTFLTPTLTPLGARPVALVSADLNGDGWPDVMTANRDSQTISVLTGGPRGRFASQQTLDAGGNPTDLVTADFNGDGLQDLVTVNQGTHTARIFLGRRADILQVHDVVFSADRVGCVAISDFDRDGVDDIWATGAPVTSLMHMGRRGLLPGPPRSFRGLDSLTCARQGADVNEDGFDDLLLAGQRGVSGFLSDGRGGYLGRRFFLGDIERERGIANATSQLLKLDDLNEDGHLDLVFTIDHFGVDHNISVAMGRGDGTFEAHQTVVANSQDKRGLTLADFNGDGHVDIFYALVRGTNNVFLLPGRGDGTFAPAVEGFDVPGLVGDAEVGDLDGDGLLDAVVLDINNNTGTILKGNGDGTYAALPPIALPDEPTSVMFADINENGRLDIAIGLQPGLLLIFTNSGAMRFEAPERHEVGDSPRKGAFGDINGDGLLELVIPNSANSTLSILLGRGHVRVGTQLSSNDQPPCPSLSLEGVEAEDGSHTFDVRHGEACQVSRVALDLGFVPESTGALSMTTPQTHSLELGQLPQANLIAGRNTPESLSSLARLEGQSINGRWTLHPDGFELDASTMLVNTFPPDPFGPLDPAEACTALEDQPFEPDLSCRLAPVERDGEVHHELAGLTLTDDLDEDAFLLEGAFDGAFIRGQTITATVTTDDHDAALLVELRAHRASRALAIAQEVQPGVWTVSLTVPPDYSGRYFAVHVRGVGVDNLEYAIEAPAP